MTDLDIEQGTNHYYFENTKRRFVSRQLSHPASSRPSDDGSHNASDLEFIDYEIDLLSTPSDVDEMSQDPRNTIRKEDDEDGCDSNFDVDVDVDLSSLGIDTFTERIYRETSTLSPNEYTEKHNNATKKKMVGTSGLMTMETAQSTQDEPFPSHPLGEAGDDSLSALNLKTGNTTRLDREQAYWGNDDTGGSQPQVTFRAAKLFGFSLVRVMAVCGCLVVLSLAMIVVAVAMLKDRSADKDNASSGDSDAFRDRITQVPMTDITPVPTSERTHPTTTTSVDSPTTTTTSVLADTFSCLPDLDTSSFLVDKEEWNCEVLRQQSASVQQAMCQKHEIIFWTCRLSCGNC